MAIKNLINFVFQCISSLACSALQQQSPFTVALSLWLCGRMRQNAWVAYQLFDCPDVIFIFVSLLSSFVFNRDYLSPREIQSQSQRKQYFCDWRFATNQYQWSLRQNENETRDITKEKWFFWQCYFASKRFLCWKCLKEEFGVKNCW